MDLDFAGIILQPIVVIISTLPLDIKISLTQTNRWLQNTTIFMPLCQLTRAIPERVERCFVPGL